MLAEGAHVVGADISEPAPVTTTRRPSCLRIIAAVLSCCFGCGET
ncbi:hypothetical protein [Nocardia sp. 852002-20019_SCH5090214]|nr:hypothetical protein [Nocardia sp. 852002-20019_SCH5090214]